MFARRLLNADFLYGAAMLSFSALWLGIALGFPPGTQDGVPGCGVFPALTSSVLAAMAVGLMLRSFIRPTVFFGFTQLPRTNSLATLGTFAILAVYLLLWYHVEYVTATIIATSALGFLYRVNWKICLVLALGFSFGSYYVFGKFLLIILELH
jgi:hypothetical protein